MSETTPTRPQAPAPRCDAGERVCLTIIAAVSAMLGLQFLWGALTSPADVRWVCGAAASAVMVMAWYAWQTAREG